MKRKQISTIALLVGGLLAGSALAQSTTTTTTGTTTTGTTTTGATTTGATTTGATTTALARTPLKFHMPCPGGGTRTSTGGWDAATGLIDLEVTVSGCKWGNDEVHDGTRSINGTFKLGEKQTYAVDLTIVETFKVTRDSANVFTHTCTVTKKGTLDDPGDRFNGKETRECTNEGEFWDPDRWLEGIMRHGLEIAVPKQPPGKSAPPRGPGNACNTPAATAGLANAAGGHGKRPECGD